MKSKSKDVKKKKATVVKAANLPTTASEATNTVSMIPIKEINGDPANNVTRHFPLDKDKTQELADRIKALGHIIEPLIVAPKVGGKPHVLVAGYRRFNAAKLLGMTTVPCLIDRKAITPKDIFAVSFAENSDREGYSSMEYALNIADLRELNGWKGAGGADKVSKYLGVSRATVTQYEKLLTLPKPLQKAVHEGTLANWIGFELADPGIPDEKTREAVIALAEEITVKEDKQKVKAAGEKAAEKATSEGKGKAHVEKARVDAEVAKESVVAKARAKAGGPRVSGSAVRKAKSGLGVGQLKTRILSDWVNLMAVYDCEPQPPKLRAFAKGMGKWAKGEISDKAIIDLFDETTI